MSTEIALTIIRIAAGIAFLYHGWPKLKNWKGTFQWLQKEKFPLPVFSTTALAVGETFGGLFLILGLFVVEAAIFTAVLMFGAVLFNLVKRKGWDETEKSFLLLAMSVAIAIGGGGAWVLA